MKSILIDEDGNEMSEEAIHELTRTLDSLPFYVLLVDSTHHIILANKATLSSLGKDLEHVVGGYCPAVVHGINGPYPGCPLEEAVEKGECAIEREVHYEQYGLWVLSSVYPTDYRSKDGHRVFLHLTHDITDRKVAEQELRDSLEEKMTMIQEIHHRVKNNMQIIQSILRLNKAKGVDVETGISMDECIDRIHSMSMVHEILYESDNLELIQFMEYLQKLLRYLNGSYNKGGRIETRIEGDDATVDLDTAIPLGLIVNELTTNAFKHAFPEGSKGEISIHVSVSDETITVTIRDNGVGIPDEVIAGKRTGLGESLVKALIKQVNGELSIDNTSGTEYVLTLPKP